MIRVGAHLRVRPLWDFPPEPISTGRGGFQTRPMPDDHRTPTRPNGGRQHDGPAEKHRPRTNEHVIPRRSEAEPWESASPVPWGKEYGLPRPCGPRNDSILTPDKIAVILQLIDLLKT